MSNYFSTESPENYQQKCCCALVVDVSGSMNGDPIRELNNGLQEFYIDIQTDSATADKLEIALIEFSDSVKTLVYPSLAVNFTMPTLVTKGTTKLVDGVREGITVVRSRKSWYKQTGQPYYRPWIILITDGAPDSGQDVDRLAVEIRDAVSKRDFIFYAIGVKGADMNMLTRISSTSMPPGSLQGLKFSGFFHWLSASFQTVTHSKDGDEVNLPPPINWMKGFSI